MSDNIAPVEQRLATLQPSEVNQRDLHSQLSSLMRHKFNPLDIIFSCHVCRETLDSIYSEPDGNQGLRYPASENGAVVRLWLTECAHLTCAKHLEGGGVPFHPADQPPRAACPVCSGKQEDVMPKKLYAVHGLRDGDFDLQIPATDLEFPPPVLDASNPNMEGAKFQFIALWRYSTKLRNRLDDAERDKKNLQDKLDAQELRASRLAAMVMTEQIEKDTMMVNLGRDHDRSMEQEAFLERTIENLQQEVKQWDHWKARQAEITAYLNLLAPLARAHLAMREQLWGLGLDVPDIGNALHLFGSQFVRLSGTHRFSLERSADNVAVEGSGVIASGNGTGVRQSLTQSVAVDEQRMTNQEAAPFAVEAIIQQARSRPDDPDKKQYMYGMKRQRPDTTETSTRDNPSVGRTQRRRLLENRDLMPPPALRPPPRLEDHPFYTGRMTAAIEGPATPYRHGNQQQAAPHESSTASSDQASQRANTNAPSLGHRPNRAPNPSLPALSTPQDGELDNVGRGGHQQPSPSPSLRSSSSQRLTLPPTTSRTHGTTPSRRGGPGLSANVRTSSSPVVYGPPPTPAPRRPLPPLPSGNRHQLATGPRSPFFTPTTPRREDAFLADPRLRDDDDDDDD